MRPQSDFLGALVLCPHCNQILEVIAIDPEWIDGVDPWSGKPSKHFRIQLADGYWARMWYEE